MFLRILQNSQVNTSTRVSFLKKLQIYRIYQKTLSKALSKKEILAHVILVNSSKFLKIPFFKNPLDDCFCINTFRLFKNDVTHIFRLSIFSAYFEDWEQEWAQYFKPLAWSLFPTQSKIWDGAVFGKIVSSLKTLSISAKKPIWLGSNYASVSSH